MTNTIPNRRLDAFNFNAIINTNTHGHTQNLSISIVYVFVKAVL